MGLENVKKAREWLLEAKENKAITDEHKAQADEVIQQTFQRVDDINMFARRIKQAIQQFSYLCLDTSIPADGVEDATFEEIADEAFATIPPTTPETPIAPNPETISPTGQEV